MNHNNKIICSFLFQVSPEILYCKPWTPSSSTTSPLTKPTKKIQEVRYQLLISWNIQTKRIIIYFTWKIIYLNTIVCRTVHLTKNFIWNLECEHVKNSNVNRFWRINFSIPTFVYGCYSHSIHIVSKVMKEKSLAILQCKITSFIIQFWF